MSCCQNRAGDSSPDAYQEALKLFHLLESGEKNPWMEVPGVNVSDDYFHTEFSVLKHCGYVILFMTRGYARCIWNLREFYYAMLLNKSTFLIEVEMDQLDLELAGNWLLSQLRRIMKPRRFQCGQYHEIVKAIQENEKKRGSDINFPFLAKLEPDERKRKSVEEKLQRETWDIQDQFNTLVLKLDIQLSGKCPVEPLARSINQFLKKKILKSRSVTHNKVFKAIRKYSSFYNYRLVEIVINATEVLTDHFNSYKRDFARYASRRLYLSPYFTGATLGDAEVVIKTDLTLRNEFHDLDKLRWNVCGIFEIEDLRMLSVDKGCVKLICAVSYRIKQKVFPLSNKQKEALSKLRLLCLCCGEYQYTFKQVFYV